MLIFAYLFLQIVQLLKRGFGRGVSDSSTGKIIIRFPAGSFKLKVTESVPSFLEGVHRQLIFVPTGQNQVGYLLGQFAAYLLTL